MFLHRWVLHCATHTDCWDGLGGLERQKIFYHRKRVQRLSCPAQLPATDWSQVLTGTPRACLSCCRHPPGMAHPTNVIPIPWAPPLEPPNLPHMGQALEISEGWARSLSVSSVYCVHAESLTMSELWDPLWATAWADYRRKINLSCVLAWPWPEPGKVNAPITPTCVCGSTVNTNGGHWPSLSCSPRPGVWSFGLSAQVLVNKCPFLVRKGM